MSLKFDEALEIVVEKLLETPKPKYQTYLRDGTEISAKIDQELIKINSIFKGTVSNWDETINLYKTEVTKLQIPLLLLKIPFAVEPQQVHVFSNDDKVQKVNLKTSVNHPAVENGYLNGEKLTQLFIWDLNRVIDRILKITCSSGKIYKLGIDFDKTWFGGICINVFAMENDSQDVPSILYTFLLSFEFTNQSSKFSYASNFFHQSKESTASAKLMKIMKVACNVNILMLTLVNKSSKISPFALRNIIYSMNIEPASGIGSLLLHAIERCLPFVQNPGPLISAYGKLLQLKQSNSVPLSDLKEMFGLK